MMMNNNLLHVAIFFGNCICGMYEQFFTVLFSKEIKDRSDQVPGMLEVSHY